MKSSLERNIVLTVSIIVLTILWLPTLEYPIISDTAVYALLGESFWKTGTYVIHKAPYAKHLPLYPILSYPFIWLFGFHAGMKIASLLSGIAVMLASYSLIQKTIVELRGGKPPRFFRGC